MGMWGRGVGVRVRGDEYQLAEACARGGGGVWVWEAYMWGRNVTAVAAYPTPLCSVLALNADIAV